MKTLIWKLRYTLEIHRRAALPWLVAWDYAGASLECGDTDECPIDCVQDEFDYWEADSDLLG